MMAFPKPRPHALDKRDKAAALAELDRAENAKVKKRHVGRCEVIERDTVTGLRYFPICRGTETHHLKGGNGRRNRGDSALARWKLWVCRKHHAQITQHILVPVNPQADALSIVYERRR